MKKFEMGLQKACTQYIISVLESVYNDVTFDVAEDEILTATVGKASASLSKNEIMAYPTNPLDLAFKMMSLLDEAIVKSFKKHY